MYCIHKRKKTNILYFDNYEEIKIPIKIDRHKIGETILNKLRNKLKITNLVMH
jgi:hypothetical protein